MLRLAVSVRLPLSQHLEALPDRHAAICNACDYHDVCGGCCRWAELALLEGDVFDDAAGYRAKDSLREDSGQACADGIGAGDGAVSASLFGLAVNEVAKSGRGPSTNSG